MAKGKVAGGCNPDGMRLDLMRPDDVWYWVNVGWGCGAVVVRPELGVIVDGARIFMGRYLGRPLTEMAEDQATFEIKKMKKPTRIEAYHTHRCKVCGRGFACDDPAAMVRRCRKPVCERCRGGRGVDI